MTEVAAALAGANILLLLALLSVYGRNYRRMRSRFVLGLLVFAGLLLVENGLALYFNITMMGLYADRVAFQGLVLRAVETLALTALAVVTWRT